MDGLTLAIDASTYTGSVAVIDRGRVAAERAVAMRGEREERLMPLVAAALEDAGAAPRDLVRIVCGSGPGSFTSLRIAASIAKGLASALAIPLFPVSSLALAAVDAGTGRWLVATDAQRAEHFVACYAWDGRSLDEVMAPALAPDSEIDALALSLGAARAAAGPHARAAAPMLPAIVAAGATDLAGWEPSYGRAAEAQVRWEAAHGRPLGERR